MPRRVAQLVVRIRRSAFPEIVAVSLSAALVAIGLTFVLAPDRFQTPTWAPMWAFASPVAWALAAVFAGTLSALVVLRWRELAPAPLILQTGIWGTISALITWGAAGGGVPAAAVIYTVPAWLSLLLVVLYISEARHPDHTAAHR
ncbi:hypothetical protein NGH33_02505 [Micrococcus yunnanensis]|nr:hypothetical protein [Micrococcus yunnanensis]MCO0632840.1 hypothetical protein [Micrococcus yunnanensis]